MPGSRNTVSTHMPAQCTQGDPGGTTSPLIFFICKPWQLEQMIPRSLPAAKPSDALAGVSNPRPVSRMRPRMAAAPHEIVNVLKTF